MNYKPDESMLIAYLYGELTGDEKEKVEQFLLENPEAKIELQKLQSLRKMLAAVPDKEVIAPPIFMGDGRQVSFWQTAYFKAIVSIAASLVFIILIGKVTGLHMGYADHELRVGFGDVKPHNLQETRPSLASLTPEQVQAMINTSLTQNNQVMETSLKESQQKLNASIQRNLVANSNKIDKLVHEASLASEGQIQQYVASLQRDNMQLVKDYFQLSSSEQKKYIEDLLVDFAKYLKQQQNDDLQIVQSRLNNLEKNTDIFKQETEQILTSIISNGSTTTNLKGTRN